ncbi:MAG: YicC/YloC family endoribonuclease [Terriglobales bacterium]
MPIRSMTGFAQVRGEVPAANGESPATSAQNQDCSNGRASFTLSLKSVNHRLLDLHFRLPAENDALEMKLRRVLKEKLARGHIELSLNVDHGGGEAFSINRNFVGGYIRAFRAAAAEFGVSADPDLNVVLRLPGALSADSRPADGDFESAVLKSLDELLARLNRMREEEGRGIERELRQLMAETREAFQTVAKYRTLVQQIYATKLKTRMQELFTTQIEPERILQEAALLVDRSDVQEELVRLETHINHFLGLLDEGNEVGKKLDFLLQEMNREANTLLSKTSGLTGDALKITEMGLAMKAAIEKAREQVQNIE